MTLALGPGVASAKSLGDKLSQKARRRELVPLNLKPQSAPPTSKLRPSLRKNKRPLTPPVETPAPAPKSAAIDCDSPTMRELIANLDRRNGMSEKSSDAETRLARELKPLVRNARIGEIAQKSAYGVIVASVLIPFIKPIVAWSAVGSVRFFGLVLPYKGVAPVAGFVGAVAGPTTAAYVAFKLPGFAIDLIHSKSDAAIEDLQQLLLAQDTKALTESGRGRGHTDEQIRDSIYGYLSLLDRAHANLEALYRESLKQLPHTPQGTIKSGYWHYLLSAGKTDRQVVEALYARAESRRVLFEIEALSTGEIYDNLALFCEQLGSPTPQRRAASQTPASEAKTLLGRP